MVGAGPGDPDLITLKGLKVLKSADIILYDALVNTDIFAYLSRFVEKIYVGKRAAKHRFSQGEINQMLVAHALSGAHVVRLKGGDPFVFGRGHEELQYARQFGIPVQVIPGLSSATSLSTLQETPLTHRGLSEGFWVLTASKQEGAFSQDLDLAMQSGATLVILMGMRRLEKIVLRFEAAGRGDTPVMVVQNGSLPGERKAVAPMSRILASVKEQRIGTPAIIVAGAVVRLHPEWIDQWAYDAFPNQPDYA